MKSRVNTHRFHTRKFPDTTFTVPIRYVPIGPQTLSSGAEGIVM